MKPSIAKLFLLVVLPMSLSSCGNKAHTHQFNLDDPKWEWASDYKSASLKFKCLTCDEFSEPKVDNEIDIEHVKEPTCTEKGQDKYIASVDYEGKAYSDSVLVDKGALGHNLDLVEGQAATCTIDGWEDCYQCSNCDEYFEDEDGTTPIADYEAWKKGDGKIDATGHEFGGEVTYTWKDDVCTASWECQHEGCDEKQTEEASLANRKVTEVVDKSPTCTTAGSGHYHATFTVTGFGTKDSNSYTIPATGHDFTSIEVDGVKDSYPALTEITGLSVNKVCSHGDKVLASDSEVEIVYSHGDGKLHADDNSFEVKIKNTTLKKTVAVTVNKVKVEKPTADTRDFVYDSTEQEYHVADSNYYTVTGNKKTDAGTTKVTVSLVNKNDCEWADGGTDDIQFDFTIAKGTPVISGLENSYSIKCKETIDFSNVTTTLGEVEVKIYNSQQEEVAADNLTAGTYIVKATVEGTANYNSTEATSTITVTHKEQTINPDGYIGNIIVKCENCGAIISKTPMQESELITDDDYGYSKYGCDGATIVPSDLASEFPEYASSTKKAYSGWSFNNEEKTLAMPKIEYSAYEKVSILLHTNSTNAQFISFGTSTSNDLIDFDNHGAHTSYALNCVYDEGNEKLDVTINSSIGEENSFVVNDTNVINGISALQIKAKGGAYRTIVLDSVRLNHTCSNFVDCSSNTIISESKVCEICNKYQSVSSDEKVYGTDYFANDKLNIKGDNGLALGIDSEDVGAIKIGGSQGAQTEANIYLPYVNYTHINNLVVTFSCNDAGSKIGFDASNRVETVGNTKATDKGTIRLRYENEKLIGSLFTGSGSVVTKEITDAWVINGHAQLKLNVLLNAWHYIAISKVVVNEAENNSPDVYNTSMKNELTATTYSTDKIYDCFGGRGKQYHSIDNTELQTISIPKINFKYESIIIEGAFNQGSKIGFDENDLYNTSSAGGSKEYYTVEYSGTSDGKINAKVTIYESCDPDGEGKVGDQSDHTAYTRFKTVLGSKEFTIDNADIYNGTAAASFLFSVNHTWNTNFYIAVAKVSLI